MDEEIIIDDLDFLFPELESELWALGVHLDALEEQIVFWQERDCGVSPPPLTEGPVDDDDVLAYGDWHEHLDKVHYALPGLLRSSFIVVLWAVYEAAVTELADYLRRIGDPKISDLKGGFTQRSREYFGHILQTTLYSSDEVRERLSRLEVVRHGIAHANGRLTEVSAKNLKKLNRWVKEDQGITEERGCVMLSEGFVRQGYADVNREIERLIAIAKSKGDSSKSDALNKTSDDVTRRKEVALVD